MKLEHLRTVVEFNDDDTGETWKVIYNPNGWALITVNDKAFHTLDYRTANTKTKNPTKSKSLELIRIAKKAIKNKKK